MGVVSTARSSSRSLVYKIVKTGSSTIVWICMGLGAAVLGPTFPDFRDRLAVSDDSFGAVGAAHEVGKFMGCLIAGILVDKYPAHVNAMLAAAMIMTGISTIIAPWSPYLGLVVVLFLLSGLGKGITDICGNINMINLWGDKPGPGLQAVHLGYGVGGMLAAVVAKPFISRPIMSHPFTTYNASGADTMPSPSEIILYGSSGMLSQSTLSSIGESAVLNHTETVGSIPLRTESSIEFAYLISGALLIVAAGIPFIGYHLYERKFSASEVKVKQLTSFKELVSPQQFAAGLPHWKAILMLLITMLYLFNGTSALNNTYLYTFATEGSLRLSPDEGAYLVVVFWAGYTSGRLVSVPVTMCVPQIHFPILSCIGLLIIVVLLNLFCWTFPATIWAASFAAAFFEAPVFPSGLAWTNCFLDVTGIAMTCLAFGSAVGGTFYSWVTGVLFEEYGPDSFPLIFLAEGVAMAGLYAVGSVYGHFYVGLKAGRSPGDQTRYRSMSELNNSHSARIVLLMKDTPTAEYETNTK